MKQDSVNLNQKRSNRACAAYGSASSFSSDKVNYSVQRLVFEPHAAGVEHKYFTFLVHFRVRLG
jgi:hypothetical protein